MRMQDLVKLLDSQEPPWGNIKAALAKHFPGKYPETKRPGKLVHATQELVTQFNPAPTASLRCRRSGLRTRQGAAGHQQMGEDPERRIDCFFNRCGSARSYSAGVSTSAEIFQIKIPQRHQGGKILRGNNQQCRCEDCMSLASSFLRGPFNPTLPAGEDLRW